MHIFIVYAHPSEDSFTHHVKNEFIRGLESANHTYELSDLYNMQFDPIMSESEYKREANYREDLPLPSDVIAEQDKINRSDIIVFIYPVFWTEAPAILKGWFDRVWTYGFAYGENRTMKKLEKALVICIAGSTRKHLTQFGHIKSMEQVILGDRIFDRAEKSEMILLDGTTRSEMELRKNNWDKHLKTTFNAGANL